MQLRSLRRHALLGAALLFLGTNTLCAQDTDTPAAMPGAMTPTAFDNPELVQHYQATITPDELAAHLYFFASDFFEGRMTAQRGQKLAAHYLAAQYHRTGLTPKGNVETDDANAPEAYFQVFDLYGHRLARARLNVMVEGEKRASSSFTPAAYDGHMLHVYGSSEACEGGVVFGGYGIADDDLGYNDAAALMNKGISLAGKWVLLLRDEPLATDSTSLLPTEDGAPSRWTTGGWPRRLRAFRGNRPMGYLIVGDVGPRGADMNQQAAQAAQRIRTTVDGLSLDEDASGREFSPIFRISSELADKILAPTGRTIAEIKQGIDVSLQPDVFEVPDVTLNCAIEQENARTSSENVVAFIEGSDLKDELVVISSHYDHVGMNPNAEGDGISNGADDDGSGTVTTLEIADAFMQAKKDGYGPRRSILFLNVTAEEIGLFGSRYFTDMEPLVPLENIVTNLNIDMIGRYDPTHPGKDNNYVYIIGSNLISQELHEINWKLNERTGINLDLNERFNSKDDPNQFYRRSDHWNFGKHNIPFIFFFTGTHEDYHGVGDEAHKIEYDRMARIARLIFATAWQVANQDSRPVVSGEGFN